MNTTLFNPASVMHLLRRQNIDKKTHGEISSNSVKIELRRLSTSTFAFEDTIVVDFRIWTRFPIKSRKSCSTVLPTGRGFLNETKVEFTMRQEKEKPLINVAFCIGFSVATFGRHRDK